MPPPGSCIRRMGAQDKVGNQPLTSTIRWVADCGEHTHLTRCRHRNHHQVRNRLTRHKVHILAVGGPDPHGNTVTNPGPQRIRHRHVQHHRRRITGTPARPATTNSVTDPAPRTPTPPNTIHRRHHHPTASPTTAPAPTRTNPTRAGKYPFTSTTRCVAGEREQTHLPTRPDLRDHRVRHRRPSHIVQVRRHRPRRPTREHRHEPSTHRIRHRHVQHHRRRITRHPSTTQPPPTPSPNQHHAHQPHSNNTIHRRHHPDRVSNNRAGTNADKPDPAGK